MHHYVTSKIIICICLISTPSTTIADLLSMAENVLHIDETPQTVEQALGLLTSEIVKDYFINFRCIAFITVGKYSNPSEIFQFMPLGVFSITHFHVSDIDNYGSLIAAEEWYSKKNWFDKLILTSLDHRCEGYIFQAPDLKRSINTVMKASKWATPRLSRFYIFLPYVSGENIPSSLAWDEEVREMFRVHKMRNFPDIIVLAEIRKTKGAKNFSNKIKFGNLSSKYGDDDELNTETRDQKLENLEHNTNLGKAGLPEHYSDRKLPEQKISKYLYEGKNVTHIYESKREINLKLGNGEISSFNKSKSDTFKYKYNSRSYLYTTAKLRNKSTNKFSRFSFKIITQKYAYPAPSKPLLLDIWDSNSGFRNHANLYPDKLVNLMGKPFYVASFTYLPFSYVELENGTYIIDGFEHRMVEAFTKRLNMTVGVVRGTVDAWGHVYANGSTGGIIGSVADGKADITFAANNYWQEEYRFLDYSIPHQMTKLSALAPKPVPLPRIMLPLYPFSYGLWFAVIIYLLLTVFFLYSLSTITQRLLGGGVKNQYLSLSECVFRTFGLLVLQVPEDERDQTLPRHVPMRHLVNWLILQFLVITTAYAGGLAAVLTTPRLTPPIETAEDLAASGVRWAAFDVAYGTTLMASPDPLYRSLYKQFYYASEEELAKRIMKGDMAYAVEILQGGSSAVQPFFTEESMENLRLMAGKIYGGHLGYLLSKGSPFMKKFNKILYEIKEGGLHLYLEKEIARQYMNQRLQIAITQTRERVEMGPVKLQFEHIEGVFLVLILGLALSTIGFLGEHIFFRLSGARKINEFNQETITRGIKKVLRRQNQIIDEWET